MKSPWFSSRWRLLDSEGNKLAELRRYPRQHVTTAHFRDGTGWLLQPNGWGVVTATDGNEAEIARVTRHSWIGRRWEVTAPHWAYSLISDPTPRRWHLAVGDATVAAISGSLISYNTVRLDTVLAVPAAAVVLSWHVIARPWEAAAAPRGLVPSQVPDERLARPRPVEGAA